MYPRPHRPGMTRTAAGPLAALSLAMLLSSLGTSIANVALPTLAGAFGAPFQAVQWVVLAYLLASTTLIVSAGRLGDLVGRRRLLLAGIAVFTLASGLCAAAPSLGLLVAARAMQGVGAAVMLALTVAFVGDTVPSDQTGRAMGLLGTMSATGTALGPSLGGLLIAALSWRALFAVNVPLGIVAFALALAFLPKDVHRSGVSRPRFDAPGTALLGVALGCYALAVTVGRGEFGWLNATLLSVAGVAVALFVAVESRVAAPVVELAMFRDRALRASLAMSALVSTVMMATLVVGPFYLTRRLALGASAVGFALAVGPIVTALTGVPAGRLTDRIGARRVAMRGLTGIAGGALLLAVLPTTLGLAGYLGPIALMTVCYGLFQTANNTLVMAHVPAPRRGVTSGLLSLSRNLGLITGASVMGAVYAVVSARLDAEHGRAAAAAAGMHATFVVAALLMLGALALLGRTSAALPREVTVAVRA
ncbi:MAG: MFS transporter [Gemmatimonadetes bacterium]|nr:MFS transporter [Gemmatimonadota bacterium]